MKRQTALSHHVVQFSQFLRTQKFNIGPNEEADALQGLRIIDWSNPDQFKAVLKLSFCKNLPQSLEFDIHYTRYWSELSKAVDSKVKEEQSEKPQPAKKSAPSIQVIRQWLHGNRLQQEEADIRQASDESIKSEVDLSAYGQNPDREWREVVQLMQRYVAKTKNRRKVKSNQPAQVDFRAVLRKSMQQAGEINQFAFRKQKQSKTHVVLLCDISKSMELYSKFLIQMMYAFQNSNLRIHCFVFSTSLHPVSKQFKTHNIQNALKSLSEDIEEWSGGTRIGESLSQFMDTHARKVMGKNTFTFVVSDGWDAGDISLLQTAMAKLKKKSKQLIWINPLAQGTDPTQVLGMKTALPYIDQLIPALDAASFKSYLKHIA